MTGSRLSMLVAAIAGTVVVVAGCGLSQAPSQSSAVPINWDIQQPSRTSSQAELYLSDHGTWIYKATERRDFDPQFAVGDLVWTDADEGHHYFAITALTRWGYRLQRLDDRPLSKGMTAQLQGLTPEAIDDRPDLCMVATAQELSDACGLSHRHSRWHLYAPTADDHHQPGNPLSIAGDFEGQKPWPIRRSGLAGGDRLGVWLEGNAGGADGPQLAVRAHHRDESTLRASVVVDERCHAEPTSSALVEARSADFSKASLTPPKSPHPLWIEDAAIRMDADAIISCERNSPSLLIPLLTRPLLRDDRNRNLAPSSLGLRARSLRDVEPHNARAWSRAAALVAIGDATASAFWIEQALHDGDLPDFSLTTMPILVSAGMPERALSVGARATDSAWNRENIPDYLDGLIVLLGQYGEHEALHERLGRRENLASRRFEGHRVGWYHWADLRLSLADRLGYHGTARESLIVELQDKDLDAWALAAWATMAMHDLELPIVDEPDQLTPRFASHDAATLWSAIGDKSAQHCPPQSTCIPGRYGWKSTSTAPETGELIDHLTRSVPLQLRTGFRRADLMERIDLFQSADDRAAYWLASAPMAPEADLPVVGRFVIEALREQLTDPTSDVCDQRELWRARFENSAARTRSPVTGTTKADWIYFIDWWSDRGLEGACSGLADLIDAAEDLASESTPWLSSLLPLIEDRLLSRHWDGENLDLLGRATALARRAGAYESCANWNLGISLGTIRAGRFELAETHLVEATNCLGKDPTMHRSHQLVAAYLNFERAAGNRMIRDGRIESAIADATRRRIDDSDTCVGLLPIGFQLESQFPSAVMRIADRIALQPAPHGDFRLHTASSLMDEATAAYQSGIRDLQRGKLHTAALALTQARHYFERLDHLPGLARIFFLDDLVYRGRLEEVAAADEMPEVESQSETAQALHTGSAHELVDGLSVPADFSRYDDPLAPIAALLFFDRLEVIAQSINDLNAMAPSLCDPDTIRYRDHDPSPIVIDDELRRSDAPPPDPEDEGDEDGSRRDSQ